MGKFIVRWLSKLSDIDVDQLQAEINHLQEENTKLSTLLNETNLQLNNANKVIEQLQETCSQYDPEEQKRLIEKLKQSIFGEKEKELYDFALNLKEKEQQLQLKETELYKNFEQQQAALQEAEQRLQELQQQLYRLKQDQAAETEEDNNIHDNLQNPTHSCHDESANCNTKDTHHDPHIGEKQTSYANEKLSAETSAIFSQTSGQPDEEVNERQTERADAPDQEEEQDTMSTAQPDEEGIERQTEKADEPDSEEELDAKSTAQPDEEVIEKLTESIEAQSPEEEQDTMSTAQPDEEGIERQTEKADTPDQEEELDTASENSLKAMEEETSILNVTPQDKDVHQPTEDNTCQPEEEQTSTESLIEIPLPSINIDIDDDGPSLNNDGGQDQTTEDSLDEKSIAEPIENTLPIEISIIADQESDETTKQPPVASNLTTENKQNKKGKEEDVVNASICNMQTDKTEVAPSDNTAPATTEENSADKPEETKQKSSTSQKKKSVSQKMASSSLPLTIDGFNELKAQYDYIRVTLKSYSQYIYKSSEVKIAVGLFETGLDGHEMISDHDIYVEENNILNLEGMDTPFSGEETECDFSNEDTSEHAAKILLTAICSGQPLYATYNDKNGHITERNMYYICFKPHERKFTLPYKNLYFDIFNEEVELDTENIVAMTQKQTDPKIFCVSQILSLRPYNAFVSTPQGIKYIKEGLRLAKKNDQNEFAKLIKAEIMKKVPAMPIRILGR